MEAQHAAARTFRIATWNVNGLSRILKSRFTNLENMLASLQADIVCLQETKLSKADMGRFEQLASLPGWESFFSFCTYRGGYAGTATFCRASVAPVAAESGLTGAATRGKEADGAGVAYPDDPAFWDRYDPEELALMDSQGRCVITDHTAFVVFNVYGLAVTDEQSPRFVMKLHMYEILQRRVAAVLAQGRAVLVVGDLNIAVALQDHCDYADARPSVQATFLDGRPDRKHLRGLLQEGGGPLTDLFRTQHPDARYAYTVWGGAGALTGSRPRSRGSRVDYILAGGQVQGNPLVAACTASGIDTQLFGSDHAPVWSEISVPVSAFGHRTSDMADLPLSSRTVVRAGQSRNPTLLDKWLRNPKAQDGKRKVREEETPSPPRRGEYARLQVTADKPD